MTKTLLASLVMLGAQGIVAAHDAEFKSPGPGMHFTAGVPIILFADLGDSRGSHGFVVNNVGWPQLEIWIDGVRWTDDVTGLTTVPGTNMLDTNGNPDPSDFYRFSASGLSVGSHSAVVRGLFSVDGVNVEMQDSDPMTIVVDPWPSSMTVLDLDADMTVTDLSWSNMAVRGHGHTVTVTGSLVIQNSLITDLGSLSADGIDAMVDSVDIESSIFEATGALSITLGGSGAGTIRNNEFRANNLITFVSSDPDASPVITLSGSNSSPKVFQGNRIGAGRLVFSGASNWLVGGDTDAESNILMGPRCTLYLQEFCDHITVRGNYDHHNYRGGWSQGFNLSFLCRDCHLPDSSTTILVEHNFIRSGSWPVQSLVGEFRYNVIYGYGHTWVRSATNDASIHHNIFAPEADGELNAGIQFYGTETGLLVYNNTFDGGAHDGDFLHQTVDVSGSAQIASLRNNLITFELGPTPSVVGGDGTVLYADYNAFFSPDNTTMDNYQLNILGLTEGMPGFGGHDVSGTGALGVMDGRLASTPFADTRIYPLETMIDEGAVWAGTQRVSSVLALFRAHYTPAAGSPIIDHGDVMDTDSQGRRADIGAVDRDGHDLDRIGMFGTCPPPCEHVAPTVSVTAPTEGQVLTGVTMLSATAMDEAGGSGVVLVQFQVDGATVGQAAAAPYTVAFDTSVVSNGAHVFTATALDADGNLGVSAPVNATVAGNVPRDGGGVVVGMGRDAGTAHPPMAGGCGCAAAGAERALGLPLFALLLLAMRRRSQAMRGPAVRGGDVPARTYL